MVWYCLNATKLRIDLSHAQITGDRCQGAHGYEERISLGGLSKARDGSRCNISKQYFQALNFQALRYGLKIEVLTALSSFTIVLK